MNNNEHKIVNALLIFGLLYIYYLAQYDRRVNIKDCFEYMIGLVVLYLAYIRLGNNSIENFDVFGANLSEYDSNNKASMDVFYKEKKDGRANKYVASATTVNVNPNVHKYSLYGPDMLKPPVFNPPLQTNCINVKSIIENKKSFHITAYNSNPLMYLNFLVHTINDINIFIDSIKKEPKKNIYNYPYPQKWNISLNKLGNDNCNVIIKSIPSKDQDPVYYLSVINNKLSVTLSPGGKQNSWKLLKTTSPLQKTDNIFLIQSIFNNKFLTFNNVNKSKVVSLENGNNKLKTNMMWGIVVIN